MGNFQARGVKAGSESNLPVLLGIYPGGYLGDSSTINTVRDLDAWVMASQGPATSLVAGYYDIEIVSPEITIAGQLNTVWNNGYTPYVALWSHHSALEIARGDLDNALNVWARYYKAWADQVNHMAFIAILPDMNTDWVSYGQDPANYKAAYQRIQQIFQQKGVTADQVEWVFSPYAWDGGNYPFEGYYPSNAQVDVLGMDVFQYGYCPNTSYDQWRSIDELLIPFINRLRSLSDTKPIFVAQLATSAQYPLHSNYSPSQKNDWLVDAYQSLSLVLGVRAILYFNVERECDWPVYIKGATQYDGYRLAASSGGFGYLPPDQLARTDLTISPRKIFLPVAARYYQSPDPGAVNLGFYASSYLGEQSNVDRELRALDEWAGKHSSIAGFFIDIEDSDPAYNIPQQLETLWKNGYSGLMNVMTNRTMPELASGSMDSFLHKLAKAYASWIATGPGRRAFIAPFPEMNGGWYAYGEDPENFIQAYQRMVNIFIQEGVARAAVQWVFAPNGYSEIPFEAFYPGDEVVDVIGFSSFNYGYCSAAAPWQQWKTPQEIYHPYIDRIRLLAPQKPIFVIQTGTTALTRQGYDAGRKNQWLEDTYNYLASAPAVRAVLYFNTEAECDWLLYSASGIRFDGYRTGIQNTRYRYMTPKDLANIQFTVDP